MPESQISHEGLTGTPVLAVVGHPNKGKSSIVATMAQDLSIAIADESGTTKRAGEYPLVIDGQVLYKLVDTPGFQRPRKALAWIQDHSQTADQRPQAVRDFVEAFGGKDSDFKDECELLKRIVEGAGIVYVVDGSVPYGPAYEPEMEILRYSGRPRMALINPIGAADHTQEWADALGQYFSVVRVFDAHQAEFSKQLDLLKAFAELDESWRAPMGQAVDALQARRDAQAHKATTAIARLLVSAVTHQASRDIRFDADPKPTTEKLMTRYQDALRKMEQDSRRQVERAFGHEQLDRREDILEMLDADLFSEASRRVFGMTRQQAAVAGVAAGAGGGAVADLAFGGLSLGVATGLGAIAGGTAAWMGFDKLARVNVLKLRELGVRRVTVGPANGPQLPGMLLSRAWHHAMHVSGRTHAQRGALDLSDGERVQAPDEVVKQVMPLLKPLWQKRVDDGMADGIADELAEVLRRWF